MYALVTAVLAAGITQTAPPVSVAVAHMSVAAVRPQIDTTFAVPANGVLELDVMNGSVTITTWDRNAMRVRTRGNERLDIDRDGRTVSIEPDDFGGWQRLDMDIVVPRRFNLQLEGVNLAVTVDGVQGEIDVENVEGAIVISNVTGPVSVESVSGDVALSAIRGPVSVSTTNKAVRLDDIRGSIEAETVNGSITMRRIDAARVEASTVQGIVEYQGTVREGGQYYLGTHNGRITMAIPEQASARITVETHNGKVETSFPVQVRGRNDREYTITVGGGSARIQLETFNGSVYLVRPDNR